MKFQLCSHSARIVLACCLALGVQAARADEPTAQLKPAGKIVPVPQAETKPAGEQVAIAGLDWHTDYYTAYREAADAKKMLLVDVRPTCACAQQDGIEKTIAADATLQAKLKNCVLLRVTTDAKIDVDGQAKRLMSFSTFSDVATSGGFVLIDLVHNDAPYYGRVVSALPYAGGKYYSWQNSHLAAILDLPAGTLTQRTMIWAVRVHPERPQSTWGQFNPGLAAGATSHSTYQASIGVQGHQNFGTRFASLSQAAGSMGVQEVVAESWPNQNMIDSCLDCVRSWRYSPGHWGAVSRPHRAFGYDIRRGNNGIWYGTGIFAD